MPERTRHQAIDRFLDPLSLVLSCVTLTQLGDRRYAKWTPGEPLDVMLGGGEPVRLRGLGRIHLRVRLRLLVEQADPPRGLWDTQIAAYEYRLSDQDDREIVAYHWHPDSASDIRTPHLHLGSGAEVGLIALTTAHLPTGQVSVSEVLRLGIDSLSVQPLRRDWDRVLHATIAES